jgi:hypothetical protein
MNPSLLVGKVTEQHSVVDNKNMGPIQVRGENREAIWG